MKMLYCNFLVNSTGYIPNSIPPRFSPEYVRPIGMIGSDGYRNLDGRKRLDNLEHDCRTYAEAHVNKASIVGFRIVVWEFGRYDDAGEKIIREVLF